MRSRKGPDPWRLGTWIMLVVVALALLGAPAVAGGEDDPMEGGTVPGTQESTSSTVPDPEEDWTLSDWWILYWLLIGGLPPL